MEQVTTVGEPFEVTGFPDSAYSNVPVRTSPLRFTRICFNAAFHFSCPEENT